MRRVPPSDPAHRFCVANESIQSATRESGGSLRIDPETDREDAVADGKCSLVSNKIATHTRNLFRTVTFVVRAIAKIVKLQCQKPCETSGYLVGRAGSSAMFQAPRRAMLS